MSAGINPIESSARAPLRHTSYSDYALRLMMYLATHPERLCTIEEVADVYDISRNHLTKLAFELGKAGFIKTVRGRYGGLTMVRDPASIGIGEVIRHTEEDFALVECFRAGKNQCVITPACRLRSVFSKALAAYLTVLDEYTLADLVADPAGLNALFALAPAKPSAKSAGDAQAQVEALTGIDPTNPDGPAPKPKRRGRSLPEA
jgi:Rrf2 family nitric oxide-sensitive transcriptional repressor